MSAVSWPLPANPLSVPATPSLPPAPTLPPSAHLFWRDWPRRSLRRCWLQLIRRDTVTFCWEPSPPLEPPVEPGETVFTREQRARYRLSWSQCLARNTRPADAPRLSVLLHGLPARFFATFGSPAQTVA